MIHFGPTFLSKDALAKITFGGIGKNCLIKENVGFYFTENIFLGSNIRIDDNVIIIASSSEAPVVIDDYVHIASGCYLVGKGGIHIQAHTTLGPNVSIFSASDDYTSDYVGGAVSPLPKKLLIDKVDIGPKAIVGTSAVLMPGAKLGENCSLGALSMLKTKTKKHEIYAGIPAKKICEKK